MSTFRKVSVKLNQMQDETCLAQTLCSALQDLKGSLIYCKTAVHIVFRTMQDQLLVDQKRMQEAQDHMRQAQEEAASVSMKLLLQEENARVSLLSKPKHRNTGGHRTGNSETPEEADFLTRLLTCPLTKKRFEVPVICADGHTYEKGALCKHFTSSRGHTSPTTGENLAHPRMVSNQAVVMLLSLDVES